jgi:death-on-curing protein
VDPVFLTLDDVLESHHEQLAEFGGSSGLRDLGLLQSALAQPAAMFGGRFLHADLFEMAAAYLFHLVLNHPFVDGNKRVALEAALVFLELNGWSIEATDEALVDVVLGTIQGERTKSDIAEFFRRNSAVAPPSESS